MITHIKGLLIEKTPTEVVIETNGVGYLINISLNTFSRLGEGIILSYLHTKLLKKTLTHFMAFMKSLRDFFL